MNVLDIRDFKQKGDFLKLAIIEAVKDTQSLVVCELPNVLRMTEDQFDMLKTSPDMMSSNAQEYLYGTIFNVMEVRVK